MFTILKTTKMGLPEDLHVTGLEPQGQEILLSNHRPVLLSFIPFYLATPSKPYRPLWSLKTKVWCFPYGYPIVTSPLQGRTMRRNAETSSMECNAHGTDIFGYPSIC